MQSLEHFSTHYSASVSHTLSKVYPVLPYDSAVTFIYWQIRGEFPSLEDELAFISNITCQECF